MREVRSNQIKRFLTQSFDSWHNHWINCDFILHSNPTPIRNYQIPRSYYSARASSATCKTYLNKNIKNTNFCWLPVNVLSIIFTHRQEFLYIWLPAHSYTISRCFLQMHTHTLTHIKSHLKHSITDRPEMTFITHIVRAGTLYVYACWKLESQRSAPQRNCIIIR